MPRITPEELIEYTVFDDVKNRGTELLAQDIIEAEGEVLRIVGHNFEDTEKYPTLPPPVKLAYLKIAQFYALINSDQNITKGIKSENISAGGYSYTLGNGSTITAPQVDHLLTAYIEQNRDIGNTTLRMRIL